MGNAFQIILSMLNITTNVSVPLTKIRALLQLWSQIILCLNTDFIWISSQVESTSLTYLLHSLLVCMLGKIVTDS